MQCSLCKHYYDNQNKAPMVYECGHENCLACVQNTKQQQGYFCYTCMRFSQTIQSSKQKLGSLNGSALCATHGQQQNYICNTCNIKCCQFCIQMHQGHYISQESNQAGQVLFQQQSFTNSMKCKNCNGNYDEQIKAPMVYECGHENCLACAQKTMQQQGYFCYTCMRFSQNLYLNQQKLESLKGSASCATHGQQQNYICNTCKIKCCQFCIQGHQGHYISQESNQAVQVVSQQQSFTNSMQCTNCNGKYDEQTKAPIVYECGHEYCLACVQNARQQQGYFCYTCQRFTQNVKYSEQKLESLKGKFKCQKHQSDYSYICLTCYIQICQYCLDQHQEHSLQILETGRNTCIKKLQDFQSKKIDQMYQNLQIFKQNENEDQKKTLGRINQHQTNLANKINVTFNNKKKNCKQEFEEIKTAIQTEQQKYSKIIQYRSCVDEKKNIQGGLTELIAMAKFQKAFQKQDLIVRYDFDIIFQQKEQKITQIYQIIEKMLGKISKEDSSKDDKKLQVQPISNYQSKEKNQSQEVQLQNKQELKSQFQQEIISTSQPVQKIQENQQQIESSLQQRQATEIQIQPVKDKTLPVQKEPSNVEFPPDSEIKNQLILQKLEGKDQQVQDIKKIIVGLKDMNAQIVIDLKQISFKYKAYKTVDETVMNIIFPNQTQNQQLKTQFKLQVKNKFKPITILKIQRSQLTLINL